MLFKMAATLAAVEPSVMALDVTELTSTLNVPAVGATSTGP
jgi:hypothetical protein